MPEQSLEQVLDRKCYASAMGGDVKSKQEQGVDVCSLEADMAFFEARLSLAGEHPDTVYQQAQIKTYRTLGSLLGDRLKALRKPASRSGNSSAAA